MHAAGGWAKEVLFVRSLLGPDRFVRYGNCRLLIKKAFGGFSSVANASDAPRLQKAVGELVRVTVSILKTVFWSDVEAFLKFSSACSDSTTA